LEFFARLMSYIGYIWMGILFLFVSASLVIDIYHFLVYVGSLVLRKDFVLFIPSAKTSFFIPFLLSIIIGVYGYFEAKDVRTEKIVINTSKIPEDVGRLRIVQISDVHLGLIVREDRLKRILSEVKKADPDILVSTGDLVDGQIDSLEKLANLFQKITPRYGKFAVLGNHEFYAGLDQALDFMEKTGFTILRGDWLSVKGVITLVGVDDPQGETYGLFKGRSEKELLSEVPHERFTLLLKHRPLVDKSSVGLFDLQLSGHVHGGQIFPFSIITGLYYPTQAGFANLDGRSKLYVSRGSGTWGPPIRFLSPPEVTLIELVHEK
jgi:predicted MPP superfamily phosphohydrolase